MPDACLGHRVPFTYSFIPRSRLQTNPLQKPTSLKTLQCFAHCTPGNTQGGICVFVSSFHGRR